MIRILSIIFSGALLFLAFPKVSQFWLAWVALIPFFVSIEKTKHIKTAFLNGILFGLIYFGGVLFWVNTLNEYAGNVVFIGYFLLILYQSFFMGLFAYFYFRYKRSNWIYLLVPLNWVFIEWLRSIGPYGISAGSLAYSQVAFLPIVQSASFWGVYGISAIIVLFNFGLVKVIINRNFKSTIAIIIIALIVMLNVAYGFYSISNPIQVKNEIKVALIQGNVPQKVKMNPLATYGIFKKYQKLTSTIKDEVAVIIWPENTITSYLLSDQTILPKLQKTIKEKKVPFLVGSSYYNAKDEKTYNSLLLFSQFGKYIDRYDKQRLVPFGEYLPYRSVLYPMLSVILKRENVLHNDFDANHNSKMLKIGKNNIGVGICFESTFSDLMAKRVLNGANFLLIVTNDAWFGRSAAAYQHMDNGILRAIENRRYLVQAANTGISFIANPQGEVMKKLKLDREGIIVQKVGLLSNKTFYNQFGESIFKAIALIYAFILFLGIFPLRSPLHNRQ